MNNIPSLKNPISNSFFERNRVVNPRRDWYILVLTFTILIVIIVVFDYNMYKRIIGEEMYVAVKSNELVIENLKFDDFKKITDNFEVKKAKLVSSKLENLIDPSI